MEGWYLERGKEEAFGGPIFNFVNLCLVRRGKLGKIAEEFCQTFGANYLEASSGSRDE